MKLDRFLIAIIAGIALVTIVAILLFLTRRDASATYPPDDTPEGVVAAYVMALQNGDWERAHAYLAEGDDKPDLGRFRQTLFIEEPHQRDAGVEIEATQVDGDRATVNLMVVNIGGGLFADIYRNPGVAILERQDGAWKIVEMPYPFWSFSWYQPDTLPRKP